MKQKNNGEKPAYPIHGYAGLTKREYFAAMAMQGIISHGHSHGICGNIAVDYADGLISALEHKDDNDTTH